MYKYDPSDLDNEIDPYETRKKKVHGVLLVLLGRSASCLTISVLESGTKKRMSETTAEDGSKNTKLRKRIFAECFVYC